MSEMSKDDLLKVGFVLGNAAKFIKAFAALSSAAPSIAGPASSHFAAGGGVAAPVHDMASLALSPSPPISTAAVVERTFASSNFKLIYERTEAPQFQDQVLTATHRLLHSPPHAHPQLFLPLRLLLVAYCTSRGTAEAVALSFFQDIQRESFKHHDELLDKDKMEVAATRIWTSAQTLQCVPGSSGTEFCSLLNEVLRGDDAVSASELGGSALL